MKQLASFGRWRQIFWPIHREEAYKLLPMLAMAFLICFNYSVLKILKDTLIITPQESGAEILPFLKVWGILPAAVLITSLYAVLVRHMSQQKVMITMILGFLAFYNVFGFFIYPNRHELHMHAFSDWLMSFWWMPEGASSWVAMIRYWTLSLFYIGAELWSTMILSVLFWGFANEITKLKEAPRFYPMMGVWSSLATFVAGWSGQAFTLHQYNPMLPFGSDAWEQTLMIFMALMTISGLLVVVIYYWLSQQNRMNPLFQGDPEHLRKDKRAKETFTFTQSIRYLARSPYLRDIAILVVAYNLVNSACEVVWKGQVKQLYPETQDMTYFFSAVTQWTGLLAAALAFVVPMTIRRKGWTFTAILTPLILTITGVFFFGPFFASDQLLAAIPMFASSTPLFMIVYVGAMQNILSRSSKYSIFDATKEMAFIPLSMESRLKGKAAIDGVGSRLGKSGGSVALQVLIITLGSLERAIPVIVCLLILMTGAWLASTYRLGRRFKALQQHPERSEADEFVAQEA